MKTLSFLLPAFAMILITGCDYEKPITTQTQVQFTIGSASFDESPVKDLPDNFSVDLRLASGNGEARLKNIIFRKAGNDYISHPIEMRPGDYEIKEFLILSENLTGVPGLVDAFRVDRNVTSVFIGDVAAKLKHGQPLSIAVNVQENGKEKLTDAIASIYTSEGEFFEGYQLSARINRIAFTGDPDAIYELIIEKEGYWPSSTFFVYNELEKKRMEIGLSANVLEPGPAITFQPSATVFYMQLQFMGTGSVVLDWQNGHEKETIEFNVDPENEAGTAFFPREMSYAVSIPTARITGDVHLLKGIYFDADANGLDARYATGLQILVFTGGEINHLDLAANNQLTSLRFNGMYYIGEVILPQQHLISSLQISMNSYDIFPSESQLNYIIDNIHANAITQNIGSGSIMLSGVNVAEQSVSKLIELQSDYGWSVSY
jgi:hypothetical protein